MSLKDYRNITLFKRPEGFQEPSDTYRSRRQGYGKFKSQLSSPNHLFYQEQVFVYLTINVPVAFSFLSFWNS